MRPLGDRIASIMGAMVQHRAQLPRFVNAAIDDVGKNPDGILARIADVVLGARAARPEPTGVPAASTRVFIGPTNYSGQGWLWARALERAGSDLAARNLAVELPGGFDFRSDTSVPISVYNRSREWQSAELASVLQFTHVLFEAERALFGSLLQRDVASEARRLTEAGLSVAFLCHGTDIRSPRLHASLTPWSPYGTGEVPQERRLQRDADANRALLQTLDRPVFVSTPDLLLDVPWAAWCPVVVDTAAWAGGRELFAARLPAVTHIPSMGPVKGTHLIQAALAELHDEGIIEYRRLSGIPSADMPRHIRDADIVIDQFRIGSYGVAAVEAMAAGRVVVGHVLPQVRDTVKVSTGMDLPIAEADPDSLKDVIVGLLGDRGRRLADAGPTFAVAVHSGDFSAAVMQRDWIAQPTA